MPTVAYNFRKIRKGRVTFKLWDVAGRRSIRGVWARLKCLSRTAQVSILVGTLLQWCGRSRVSLGFSTVPDLLTPDVCLSFIVDSFEVSASPKTRRLLTFLAQRDKFNIARFELHQLIGNPTLSGVPLLVVRLCYLFAAPKMIITCFQLGNKNDLDGHATVKELIRELCVLSHPDRQATQWPLYFAGN